MVFTLLFLLSDVALAAVLVPVLVMVLTALILLVVCARHWKNRYELGNREGTEISPTRFLLHDLCVLSV